MNNLDLNNDGKTDYIIVIYNKTNSANAIVLQTSINDKEIQNIAVVEIEKDKPDKVVVQVVVQVVVNEDLYSKDYIFETSVIT